MHITSFCFSALVAVSSLTAQGNNTVLLGTLDPRPGNVDYNDIWGYTAPNGDEYALLGSEDGTTIVDCTNPAAPVSRGFIAGPNSPWRDIRTYQTYAYVVTEGGSGMQIIDLTNPNSPSLVTTWGTNRWGNAHNISIDTSTGIIYVPGTNNGMVIADASSNPTNPTFVQNYNAPYLHDFQAQGGFGYGSAINSGFLRILDLNNNLATVSDTTTPSNFTHQAWPTADNNTLVTTDEQGGGVLKIYDITNKSNPIARGQYTPISSSIPHNAFIIGNIVHISWYTEGYRAVDISDPNNPVEVASYDTTPGGGSSGFSGAWGCYPFSPSGNIFISDIGTGLYVLRRESASISSIPLPDTINEAGPYTVTATAASSSGISTINLVYSVDGGAQQTVAMTSTGTPNQFSANIPGQQAPSAVSYFVDASTGSGGSLRFPATGTSDFIVGVVDRVFFQDFESGDGGFISGFSSTQNDWQFGSPTGSNGTSSGVAWQDPGQAASGANCWGNDLGIGNFNGAYQSNVNNWLDSPTIPTNGVQGLKLRFQRWVSVEDGQFDQTTLLVNGQQVWQNPTGSNLTESSWTPVEYDISSITNGSSTVQVRFQLQSDAGLNLGGWALDDFELVAISDCLPLEIYGTATVGSNGLPQIGSVNNPQVGSSNFELTCTNLVPNGFAFLVGNFTSVNTVIAGVNVNVQPAGAVTLGLLLNGAGDASYTLPIPNDPALDGLDVFFQWVGIDPAAPGGNLSGSEGIRVRACIGS